MRKGIYINHYFSLAGDSTSSKVLVEYSLIWPSFGSGIFTTETAPIPLVVLEDTVYGES